MMHHDHHQSYSHDVPNTTMNMLNKHCAVLCFVEPPRICAWAGSLTEVTLLWHSFFSWAAVAPRHGFITKAQWHLRDITCQTNYFSPPTLITRLYPKYRRLCSLLKTIDRDHIKTERVKAVHILHLGRVLVRTML